MNTGAVAVCQDFEATGSRLHRAKRIRRKTRSPSTSHCEIHYAAVRPAGDTDPDAIEQLADEIARLSAHIDAATYRLLMLIAEFDRLRG